MGFYLFNTIGQCAFKLPTYKLKKKKLAPDTNKIVSCKTESQQLNATN